jgi:hypothetical protein
MNAPDLQEKIAGSKGRLAALIKANKSDKDILTEYYLRAFGREPQAEELKDALEIMAISKDRNAALQDFVWMFLNSKEFLFNH